jgi:hypothetical protein
VDFAQHLPDMAKRRDSPGRRPRTAAGLLGVLALATACTSHSKVPPAPTSEPASSTANPATDLASVAQVARDASYTGIYTADSADNPPRSSTIKVYRTATRSRLDVAGTAGDHVLIQVDPTGTYTCKIPTTGKLSCLTLAGPGQPVPANLDPLGQTLFTTTLDVLAQGADLTVATEPPSAGGNGVPPSTCYALIAAPAGGASPGTYCFTAAGILTRAQFRSSVLQLTALSGAPLDSDFVLPVTPLPMSSVTPSSS